MTMRASVFIAASLDGFIARPDGGLDWLAPGPDGTPGEDHGYSAFIDTVDAILIGRNTIEIVLAFEAWPYGDKPVYVLTNRPLPETLPVGAIVRRIAGDAPGVVAALEAAGVRHAYVDGGLTIQGFLAAGLIQSLVVNHIPVLLGSGIPLFGPLPGDIRLRHVATRTYPSGFVQSEYEVIRESGGPSL